MSAEAMKVSEASVGYSVTTGAHDVPPGYRWTEVGVIPEDWESMPLGHAVAYLQAGVSVNSVDDDSQWDSGEPVILKTSSVQAGWFIPHEAKTIAARDRSRAKLNPRGNTILISRMNTIDLVGECGFVDRDYPVHFIPDRLWMTQFSSSVAVSARWLSYVLSSSEYRKRLQAIATGTSGSMKNIAKNSLLELPVAYPSLPEQRTIAAALSDVDGLIGALDKLIAKKRAIKQAAMQQLLTGKTRLPGFSGEWETKRLGEALKVRHGRSQRGVVVADGRFPILASGGEIGRTNTCLYDKPSVLIGRKGTIDAPQFASTPFWTVDTLFFTEIADDVSAKFIFYKFCMINWRSYNEASGVPSLNARTIENIEISLPQEDEQEATATVLSDMDAEITALEQRRDKTKQIRQGMMQQLLTGRIRLVKPEAAA